MRRIQALLRLSWADRLLLAQAAALIGIARLGLWLLPFRAVHRLSTNAVWPIAQTRLANRPSVERVAWAITTASRFLPSATCLAQALATQALLRRFGDLTQIRIGVRHDLTGQFKAHAWVEHHGKIVLGGTADEIALFTVLPSLD